MIKLIHGILFLGLATKGATHAAEANPQATPPPEVEDGMPKPLQPEIFEGLLANPPFTRSLGHSDTLILTGIAHFQNETIATLLDTKTMESQVVSQKPNRDGWQLVGIGGDPSKMQTWTARIQMRGGEVASIRYQTPPKSSRRGPGGVGTPGGPGGNAPTLSNSQLAEARQAAVNYREGFSSDGYPRQPPAEIVDKLSRMNVEQRESINRQMIGLSNRGMSMEERRRIYEDMVNRTVRGSR